MKKMVVFTDLDGTLLDYSTYSFEKAKPALDLLKQRHVPLVICSSKTRSEIEYYRKKLSNGDPFISENGGGIFIPKNYFGFRIGDLGFAVEEREGCLAMKLGASYPELRGAIERLREEGFTIRGFGDMTVEEVADFARMTLDEARMAKERDFDEPFLFEGDERETRRLRGAIKSKGFNFTQGRFFHILGDSDKGKAVEVLSDLYRREFGKIATVALGDSPNDIPMLECVDYPVVVQKNDGSHDSRIDVPNLIRAEGIGPEGWDRAVREMVETLL